MKTIIKLVLIPTLLVILLVSFSLPSNESLKKLIFTGMINYEKLKNEAPKDYDSMSSWLDVKGVRSKYAFLKSILNLGKIESETGIKVFVSGPHVDGNINYESMNSFGHYNPELLNLVYETLYQMKNENAMQAGTEIYDLYFRQMFRTYYESYNYLNNTSGKKIRFTNMSTTELIAKYQLAINNNESSFNVWENFRPFADFMDKKLGYDWYEADTSAAFWVRRKMDGTDKQFMRILTLVIETYDKDFIQTAVY